MTRFPRILSSPLDFNPRKQRQLSRLLHKSGIDVVGCSTSGYVIHNRLNYLSVSNDSASTTLTFCIRHTGPTQSNHGQFKVSCMVYRAMFPSLYETDLNMSRTLNSPISCFPIPGLWSALMEEDFTSNSPIDILLIIPMFTIGSKPLNLLSVGNQ